MRVVDIVGKTVLLTGATGGLGRATAELLAANGASLVLSSRKRPELEALATSLAGDGHMTIVSDLAEAGAAEMLAADAGEVHILIANAGLPGTGKLESFSAEEVTRALRVNLEAPALMARALAPAMEARGEGHMVFVSSLAGKAPAPRSSVYCATKFGLRGFAMSLRADLAKAGVGVSIVSPGFIRDAGMFADAGAKAPAAMGTATPGDVADAVLKAINRNKVEIAVAPLRSRVLAHLGLASPRIASRATGGSTAKRSAEELAAGQLKKR